MTSILALDKARHTDSPVRYVFELYWADDIAVRVSAQVGSCRQAMQAEQPNANISLAPAQNPYTMGASGSTTMATIIVIGKPTLAKCMNPYPPSFCTIRLV